MKINRLLFVPIGINLLILFVYILVSTTVLADARNYKLRDSFSQFKNEYNKYEVIKIDSYNPVLAVHILNKDYLKAGAQITDDLNSADIIFNCSISMLSTIETTIN